MLVTIQGRVTFSRTGLCQLVNGICKGAGGALCRCEVAAMEREGKGTHITISFGAKWLGVVR